MPGRGGRFTKLWVASRIEPTMSTRTSALHWPEYLIVARAISGALVRRAFMGLAMGSTAVAIIYSPWGQRSGAHMNPAVTLTFFRLGKVARPDCVGYVTAQFAGAIA